MNSEFAELLVSDKTCLWTFLTWNIEISKTYSYTESYIWNNEFNLMFQ
jgi:hypothetical protein